MIQPTIAPLPGEGVTLVLDKSRTLRLPFNSLVALGKATKENPLKPQFWEGFDDPERLRVTLWACLIHEDKTLTVEQVGDMISLNRLAEIGGAVAAAISASMPDKKDEPAPAAS